MQKRAMAIHDISGFGRCSLTVCLPILSAAGINCTVLPTAVLSTHTGGLGEFTYRDLTDDILNVAKHWQKLGLNFDAMYSGFLGSALQVDLLKEVFDMFGGKNATILVDPVMADGGLLYKTFDSAFPEKMAGLCAIADIITPNITEAALLTKSPYNPGPYTVDEIELLLNKLAERFGEGKKYVVTGVFFDEEQIGAAGFENGRTFYSLNERIPEFFPGTGDIFASVLLASLMNGATLREAVKSAVDFTAACTKRTYIAGSDPRFGAMFEAELHRVLPATSQFPKGT